MEPFPVACGGAIAGWIFHSAFGGSPVHPVPTACSCTCECPARSEEAARSGVVDDDDDDDDDDDLL